MRTTVGLASRRAGESGVGKGLIVGAVLLAIFRQRTLDLLLERVEIGARRPGHKERTNLGADEVVGATGAQKGQLLRVRRVDELQHVGRVA